MARVDMMRAFIAINLDVGGVRRIGEAARRLRDQAGAPKARWVVPTKMHATLKFFGDVDVGLAPALSDVVRDLAAAYPAPEAAVTGFDAFPSHEHARVVVAAVEDPGGGIARLGVDLERRAEELGFAREKRALRPHITLARLGGALDVRAWLGAAALDVGPVRVTELVLYRSDLSRAGAEYTAVARHGFHAAVQ